MPHSSNAFFTLFEFKCLYSFIWVNFSKKNHKHPNWYNSIVDLRYVAH